MELEGEKVMSPICVETGCFRVVSTVLCAFTLISFLIPRAESEIEVVSAHLCLLDSVFTGASPPRVRLFRIGGSRENQRQTANQTERSRLAESLCGHC